MACVAECTRNTHTVGLVEGQKTPTKVLQNLFLCVIPCPGVAGAPAWLPDHDPRYVPAPVLCVSEFDSAV